ncbi:hypothetical protein WA026_001537 [Henosepilachna vigintioctopunctata]|uniref:Uncharacterized protein n=1 Tax=Henosepilachna vigintioctopunctata TaxID=420089 RepID=A0AAW1UUW3_9CUCU
MELQNKSDKKRDVKEEEYHLDVPEESFWEGIKRHVRSYCEIASIQGLNYMVKDGVSWFERAWWIIVFILCIGGCSYMVFKIIDKWNTTPVLVSLATKETSIHEVPFPAVTICPETKISRSCLNYTETLRKRRSGKGSEIELQENLYFDFMSLLCRPDNHVASFDSFQKMNETEKGFDPNILMLNDYAEFLDECKSVTLDNAYCKWMGKVVECKKILTPILTDEGMCYSFNMFDVRDIYSDVNKMEYYDESRRNPDWDPDSGYPEGKLDDVYPRRAFMNGAKNALEVVILTKKSDVYYSCRDFALQGIRVTLNMPGRIPRPSQVFFSVGFDRLTTVAVTPSYMTTTSTVRDYDPQDRNCYFGKERKLKYFKLYSQSNCNMECFTNYTINYCGCSHFFMPRDANTSICSLDKRFCLEEARVNYPKSILSEYLKSSQESQSDGACDCLPMCTDLNYNSEISSGFWTINAEEEYEISKDYHASAVKVFFKSSYFLPTEKSELYGFTDFVSNAGGVLGLFTGFSLFSLAEIIYFLSIRLIENYRRYGYWAGERVSDTE